LADKSHIDHDQYTGRHYNVWPLLNQSLAQLAELTE